MLKLYGNKGISADVPDVVADCRIGERSSHTWFALKYILGFETRNHDGSWTEWGNLIGVPIRKANSRRPNLTPAPFERRGSGNTPVA